MNILYCISDHGFGHAVRSIPVINRLRRRGHFVMVRNRSARSVLASELPGVRWIAQRNDPGLVQRRRSLQVDPRATGDAARRWIGEWPADVERLRRLIRSFRIDVVVSDIAPHPFLAARKEGIPGIFLGSFTWLDIYRHLGTLDREQERALSEGYGAAVFGIITPFASACSGLGRRRRVGLIARRPPSGALLGPPIPPGAVLYVLGGSQPEWAWRAEHFSGTMIISSRSRVRPARCVLRIRESVPFLHYMRRSAVVVGKCGYGLAAEAIVCRKPMLLMRRPGMVDDDLILRRLKRLGIATEVQAEELPRVITDDLAARCGPMRARYEGLPPLYRRDGGSEAADLIEQAR
jgi:hypothetical protein